MAERVGFEPTLGFPKPVYHACPFTRSAPSPFLFSVCLLRIAVLLFIKPPVGTSLSLSFIFYFAIHIPACARRYERLARAQVKFAIIWRRGGDLNPRWSYPHNSFRDCRLQPLGHLSEFRSAEFSEYVVSARRYFYFPLDSDLVRLLRLSCCLSFSKNPWSTARHSVSIIPGVIRKV